MPARTDVRIDVVTIFPEYLLPLDLSLVGKAREAGLLDLRVHDICARAVDRHPPPWVCRRRCGAGMVMRPDVWGEAVDQVLASATDSAGPGAVELLVPTPSGEPLTQRTAERLAGVGHLVIACGRYEGIDARVVEHYRARRS